MSKENLMKQDPKYVEKVEKLKDQYKKDISNRPSGRPMGYIFPNRIKSILDGETPSTTVSMYNPNADAERITRKPGDTWSDDDGNVWVQHDGWLEKKSKMVQIKEELGLNMFAVKNCSKCDKKITSDNRLDTKFFALRKMCFDCVIKEETHMKIIGKFKEHEERIMTNNAVSFFRDAKQELEHYIETIPSQDVYFNDDGTQQKWEGGTEKAKEFFQKELDDVNTEIKRLEGELEKLNVSIGA